MNLLDLDYADRQLIVVRPDDEVARIRQAQAESRDGAKAQPDPAHKNAEIVGVVLGAALPLGLVILNIASRWWLRRTERRELSILQIRRAEARHLNLPVGHPLYDVVYVGNPAQPGVYYSLAEFHRQTFAHKFGEALTLLSALGANSMRVTALQGWNRETAGNLDLTVPLRAADGDARLGVKAEGSRSFLYTADLKGSGDPRLPKGRRWFQHEPEWQAFAQQRIDHDLREFTLHVRYEEDFSISADLAAKVTKVGLKAGGSFHRHTSTVWAITATFPPNQSRLLRAFKHPLG